MYECVCGPQIPDPVLFYGVMKDSDQQMVVLLYGKNTETASLPVQSTIIYKIKDFQKKQVATWNKTVLSSVGWTIISLHNPTKWWQECGGR